MGYVSLSNPRNQRPFDWAKSLTKTRNWFSSRMQMKFNKRTIPAGNLSPQRNAFKLAFGKTNKKKMPKKTTKNVRISKQVLLEVRLRHFVCEKMDGNFHLSFLIADLGFAEKEEFQGLLLLYGFPLNLKAIP